MATFEKCGENLVRHTGSGMIYLRAKIAGKSVRQSLGVTDLRIAKLKRDAELESLRKSCGNDSGDGARTLGDALETFTAKVCGSPHLRPRSVDYYREIFTLLRKTLPLQTLSRQWTAADAAAWWREVAKTTSGQRANNALGMVRRMCRGLVGAGAMRDDPTAKLHRVRIVSRPLNIPSRETIEAIIRDIRHKTRCTNPRESAAFVGFLAFSGCRHGQARAAQWEHIDGDWITFPAGVTGGKGAPVRRLPISGPLRALLDDFRPAVAVGPIFGTESPKRALWAACDRLVIPRLRLHDLRHFFASHALERGVDVPTVAKWLGHKDGGVLVLRTYGHVRDLHSLAEAEKLG